MKKEVQNQIKSFQELANATMNPVFIAALMYVRRTEKTLTPTIDKTQLDNSLILSP